MSRTRIMVRGVSRQLFADPTSQKNKSTEEVGKGVKERITHTPIENEIRKGQTKDKGKRSMGKLEAAANGRRKGSALHILWS